jgi:hypothetical protein
MGISVVPSYRDIAQLAEQHSLRAANLVVTGLTGASLNTIPHGLPNTPVAVVPIAYSADGSAVAVPPTLDGSDGTYGGFIPLSGEPGFDDTNIYVITDTGVTAGVFLVLY